LYSFYVKLSIKNVLEFELNFLKPVVGCQSSDTYLNGFFRTIV